MRQTAIKQLLLFTLIFSLAGLALAQTGSGEVDGREIHEAVLEQELAKVEAQIEIQTKFIESKQREAATLARDRQLLNSQIEKAELVIKQHEIKIARLGGDINTKEATITELTGRIEELKASLEELLRARRTIEENTLIEMLLTQESLSDFFHEADQYQYIEDSIHDLFSEMRLSRSENQSAKTDLEVRRASELDAKKVIDAERRRIAELEAEKRRLLEVTQNQAANYRQLRSENEKRAAEIRGALFRLRGSEAITFGEAYEHAKFVSSKTGVRPAFIMAIITQESNLGANIGTCNRPGDPPDKHWSEIMKPERDQKPYLRITAALGLDPEIMPLSCPWGSGWGGAMGPAQFIPSTWELYEAKITALTGHNPPSPWEPRDAFAASGIYLSELGADAGTWNAERTAALRYYAGSNWNLPKNAFYGDGVMKIVAEYQTLIDTLQRS